LFTFTTTTTSDLHQADRSASVSSEVYRMLTLRCPYAYRLRQYVAINWFKFGSSSYDSVMRTAHDVFMLQKI